MNILLCNRSVTQIGGSETWTLAMARALTQLGHDVRLRTVDRKTRGVPYDDGRIYDLAIINHHHPDSVDATIKVFTSHGLIKWEAPKPGADHYVGVSEETAQHWSADYVVRQPIDLHRFRPHRKVRPELSRVMVLSNNGPSKQTLINALEGLDTVFVGRGSGQLDDPRKMMDSVDLVISLGRGAFEAMAMNRNVLIADIHGVDGMVTPESIMWQRTVNCSGRYNAEPLTVETLRDHLARYDPDLEMRDYVAEHHDAMKIAQQYVDLYDA